MWAPRVMDLAAMRRVDGLEALENRAYEAADPQIHPNLTHLSGVMEPAIEQVSERIYSAVGFDSANSTFVVGDDGIVVIDAMTSIENMRNALTAFRTISSLPLKGIVYTHSHGDHWAGSPALVDPGASVRGEVTVIAHRMLLDEIARINGYNQPIMGARGAYQFGVYLPKGPDGVVNMGAGPFLAFDQQAGLVPPNTLVDDRLELTIAGVRMEIVWVPSEAPDEIVVWLPDDRVLQAAECVQGECYPNLYTIRGDVPRPAAQWVASMDVLRAFPAEALAKSHGRSVVGRDASAEHLRNYRDVIAWTHDQTIRYMNKGYVRDQIAALVGEMPPHLRAYETTGIEGYGSVAHAVPQIYTWYLGYNRGEVTDFDPAPYDRRQRGYVQAMGGPERVIAQAQQSMDDGDNRWAIELLGYVVRSDPSNMEARRLDAEAHRREGLTKANATWRNWYLTAAAELEGHVPVDAGAATRDVLVGLPLGSIVAGLPVRLRAEQTWYVEQRLALTVGGREAGAFTLHLRRGVLEVVAGAAEDVDATLAFADKEALADYLAGTPSVTLAEAGRLAITGDADAAARFATYFDEPPSMGRILVTLHGPAPTAD